jgi:alpha-ketoglutarate-dependent taurine dioxygenase
LAATSRTEALLSRPLSPILGVEFEDIQLAAAADSAIEAVRSTLDREGLVLLREQRLSPPELIELTRRFGEPERFDETRAAPEYPEVCVITNDARAAAAQPVYWHADGAQQPEPPRMSIFYAVRTLSAGGETLFVDTRKAYDSLPAQLRDQIEGRRAVMRNGFAQPLVRVHPPTGRRALYADFGLTVAITGLERDEARALFAALRDHVSQPESVYAHRWLPGDLAIWDNAAVLHSATRPPPSDELRLMWRTSVRGGAAMAVGSSGQ